MARLITTQLKRYKLVSFIILIIFSPILLPLALIIKIGEFGEFVLDFVIDIMEPIREFLVKTLKFDKVAMKQRESGKFDKKYGKERMYK